MPPGDLSVSCWKQYSFQINEYYIPHQNIKNKAATYLISIVCVYVTLIWFTSSTRHFIPRTLQKLNNLSVAVDIWLSHMHDQQLLYPLLPKWIWVRSMCYTTAYQNGLMGSLVGHWARPRVPGVNSLACYFPFYALSKHNVAVFRSFHSPHWYLLTNIIDFTHPENSISLC